MHQRDRARGGTVLTVKRLSDALFAGARVFAPNFSGEMNLLMTELAADPERAQGVDFVAVQFAGISRADYLAVHPQARQTAFFMTPSVRAGLAQRRVNLQSLDYPGIVRYLRSARFDVVFAQLSVPDAGGWCSAGICADFLPLAWERAKRRVAQLNPRMPRAHGSFRVNLAEIDTIIEAESPLLTYQEPPVTPVEERIGAHVSGLVRDGDTLQFGIGSVPIALARSLSSHRQLKLHTGMVSEAARELWHSGALDRQARITTGVALGSEAFYRDVGAEPSFWFTDAATTHDVVTVASTPRFIAVNSAVEVDLLGQVNAERAGGALLSGPGGLPVFAAAALQSAGGRSLISMAATARGGTVSRIVPELDQSAVCTLPRYLTDVVVTEHGVAELSGRSLDERAQALIGIAAPGYRDALANAWDRIRAGL
jgi:acyl-CoA hydrolase